MAGRHRIGLDDRAGHPVHTRLEAAQLDPRRKLLKPSARITVADSPPQVGPFDQRLGRPTARPHPHLQGTNRVDATGLELRGSADRDRPVCPFAL